MTCWWSGSRGVDRRRTAPGEGHAGEKGRNLLKEVRTHLIETARPALEAMIGNITGMKVVSLHHDITRPPGEVVLFTLSGGPLFREIKK